MNCQCAAYPVPHNDGWCEKWRALDVALDLFRLEIGATS